MVKWRTIEEGIIEVVHNKRKGIKLRVIETPTNFIPCSSCILYSENSKICSKWLIVNNNHNFCLKINPHGHIYFQKIDEDSKR
jgi:hypothetical protein